MLIGKMMSVDMAKDKFDPLVAAMMRRFKRYKPATKKALKEMMEAEYNNPDMFKDIMTEFIATWKACDANKDGKLVKSEFKDFMCRNNENVKKRIGESAKGDDMEDDKWYEAYNMLNPNKEGVTMEDFKTAREIIRETMAKKVFEPLAKKAMMRMTKYKDETKAKIGEYMKAEEENPALFAEMMTEFKNTWTLCDKNKDGVLNLEEFKDFANKHNENMKKRWGESTKGDDAEDEMWYFAYNMLSSNQNGIALMDFKKGRKMLMEIIKNMGLVKAFTPLMINHLMERMAFSPEVQAKYKEAGQAMENNPKMFAEIMKEFVDSFMACDVNHNGVLEKAEWKNFMDAMHQNRLKRYGDSNRPDDKEKEAWFNAMNSINPDKEGIALEDFMQGLKVMGGVGREMAKTRSMISFYHLMGTAIKRMMSYKPETQAKMREYMEAEQKNPELYQEIMAEFIRTWKQSDTNADGLLNMREFKTFIKKNNENMKRRWGQSVKGTDKEDEKWYQAYNMLSPQREGVSMDDFMTAKDMLTMIMAYK
jgi:Ca2+-binding EF-hand superfamily protein